MKNLISTGLTVSAVLTAANLFYQVAMKPKPDYAEFLGRSMMQYAAIAAYAWALWSSNR